MRLLLTLTVLLAAVVFVECAEETRRSRGPRYPLRKGKGGRAAASEEEVKGKGTCATRHSYRRNACDITNQAGDSISSYDCTTNLDCCYDETVSPYCFYKNAGFGFCTTDPSVHRSACDIDSTSEEVCTNYGCCYDNTAVGVPRCYFPNTNTPPEGCTDVPTERIDCGWPGIDQTTCEVTQAACWGPIHDETHLNTPWCFCKTT